MKNQNQLEKLQESFSGSEFIKSYPILNYLPLSPIKIKVIELIYSYNSTGKEFYMNYTDIASLFNIKLQSVKDIVNQLKKKEYIITNHKHNFNGIKGGSSTSIAVNIEKIINEIEDMKLTNLKQQNKQEAIEIKPNTNQVTETASNEVKQSEQETTQVEKVTEEVKSVDIRTKEQKAEAELFNSLTVQPKQEITGTFTFKNRHGEFDVPNEYLTTYEFAIKNEKRKNELNQAMNKNSLIYSFKCIKERLVELEIIKE